ncbi:AraC family transcriptional regulator [Corynebacterium hylobatis]|nr:AraC family transcriptional regulator [Corynebacterium hylobatis]
MTEVSTVQDLRSTCLKEMQAAVARAYFPHELQKLGREASPGFVRTLDLGPLTLGKIRWGADIALDCDYAEDAYEVNIVLSGHLSWTRGSRSWSAGPGEAAVFLPGKRSTITHWDADATVLGIKIGRAALHQHLPAGSAVAGSFEETMPPSLDLRTEQGRSWVNFIRSTAGHVISDPVATALPAVRDSMVASIAAPMAVFLSPAEASAPPGPYMIRRVRHAVEQDPSRRWTLDDLAAVSGVGRRRLQQVFREYVGVSPTAWLLRVRLDRAHQLLAAPSGGGGSVSEVAYACGFNHLGRFSQEFRGRFGCTPSEVRARKG